MESTLKKGGGDIFSPFMKAFVIQRSTEVVPDYKNSRKNVLMIKNVIMPRLQTRQA